MTASDLARIAGVHRTAIGAWESGRRSPTIDALARVAGVLEVPLSQLIVIPREQRSLTDLRMLCGLTQPQLASMLGLATSTLSELERGELALSADRTQKLSAALGVSVSRVRRAWELARTRPAGTDP